MNRPTFVSLVLLSLTSFLGCQKPEFTTASVTGVVMCEGQPVANAIVFFQPVPTGETVRVGKQGFSYTDAQGRFRIGTYDTDDGAVIGKHSVRVAAGPAGTKCDCVLGDEVHVMDVEVKADQEHDVQVVLKKKSAQQARMPQPPGPDDED
jgi:hypothetical protein